MASANLIAFLAIFLIVQPITAIDFLTPLLAPALDKVCDEVVCGKGTCKSSLDYTFSFICECDPGWKQTRDDDDENFRFLPCVIPNCTLDYSCKGASPPSPQVKDIPTNKSLFDPCYWAYCGAGTCNKTKSYQHTCECQEGYANLLNISASPCFSECALGADCGSLGITLSNTSASSTPNLANGENHASSILLTILIMSLAMVPWK